MTEATFWNYEPTPCRIVRVVVGPCLKETFWHNGLEGTVREAVEVEYGGDKFYLDNEDGTGWFKVTKGRGGPDYGHSSLPVAEVLESCGESNPPTRLSHKISHPDYHPSFLRVGIRFNGKERSDVAWYDQKAGRIETISNGMLEGVVEPYWRSAESRQQRRARERWEAKHGRR